MIWGSMLNMKQRNISFGLDCEWFWINLYARIKCADGQYRTITVEQFEDKDLELAEKTIEEYRDIFECEFRF